MAFRTFIFRNSINSNRCMRLAFSTQPSVKENNKHKIKSWQVHSYGGLDELQLTLSRRPIIRNPNDVIVKVTASSVNPIDVAMLSGYGSVLLNFMRQAKACTFEEVLEFPLTLGRDFAGVVLQKGHGVTEYSIGDEVWGVVPVHDQGCHAEQVLIPKTCIKKKPDNISMTEAGSMLYAAVTAWSALKITGGLSLLPAKGKCVLVLGASGGVGTMAVQMLKLWGAHVVATCSSDAIPLVESLGVIDVIDYKENDFFEKVQEHRYDIILDCAGIGQSNAGKYVRYLKDYTFSKFITLKSPMVKNFDDNGMLAGLAKNAADLVLVNFNTGILPKTSSIRWGFFIPMETSLTEITSAVKNKSIIPCIQKTYKFDELPMAYKHCQAGHLRGKLAIDFQ